ncbi:Ig-like domain-containing protein [Sunxiuqinia elliptica]|uniref:Uncharacterized protein n=1 Tax=Sunxiuqinia elliptica TaxID=655355 RepID=A0A4R6HBQ8_9BACT|nr:Ig-like domain-containing protein [Sunxiuqinia elliptica]TDO05115.1 hypothetical protein DET52_101471 [Sunxiuqinia elliptica]TDO64664.1 hypothetical protein DET65_1030 [Sunxiuqinia elliptica]
MKKSTNYTYLLSLLLIILILSCSKSSEEEETILTPPSLTITSPQSGVAITQGETVSITASATDDTGIRYIRFYIQNKEVAYTETTPYQYEWNTTEATPGSYSIKAEACDLDDQKALRSVNITLTEPQLTANYTGTIKSRQANANLPGLTIHLGDQSSTSDAAGKYEITNRFAEGHYALEINVTEDFMGTTVGFDLTENANASHDLYLYQKPENVQKQAAGFIKGVSMFDAGPWMGQDLYPDAFASTFDRLASNHSNLVTVFDPVFITEAGNDSVKMSTSANTEYPWDMLSSSQYTDLTDKATQKGLDFMFWFGVWPQAEKQLSGKSFNAIVFSGEVLPDEFWQDWFSEYTRILVDYAKLAETQSVPYISLGHGLNYATSPHQFSSVELYHSLWTNLINSVKEVYAGDLIYFGTNRSFTAQNYEGGSEIEYYEDEAYTTTFKNLFDAFGVILSNITPTPNPSIDEIKSSVTSILDRYTSFEKPIILWVWSPSVDGSANKYGHLEPVLDVSQAASNYVVDFYEQADVYEGIFEALNESPVDVLGVISHGYMYFDQFKKYAPRNMDTAFDKAASVRDKPAEQVLKFWFEKM